MASFVSSILYNSASKIESISKSYRLNHEYNTTTTVPSPPPYDSWTLSDTEKKNKKPNTINSSSVNRQCISQGMKLVSIAADEYEDGNESMALDIYLTGVDKILMALPNKTNIHTKLAIQEKLSKVEKRVAGNDSKPQEDGEKPLYLLSRLIHSISIKDSSSTADQQLTTLSNDSMIRFKQFGQYMIDIIVMFAKWIKQSPIPDVVVFIFGYLFQLLLWIDAKYHIRTKIQDFGIYCIKHGIEADEKYHLHEYITEGIYMITVAILKAVVAFKEAPSYYNKKEIKGA